MRSSVAAIGVLLLVCAAAPVAPAFGAVPETEPGKKAFETFCARCHGADGKGGDMGPPIALRLSNLDDTELVALIRAGRINKGMPPTPMPLATRRRLITYLRGLQRDAERVPVTRLTAHTTDGRTLDGVVVNQGFADLQLRTDDGRVHLLRRDAERFRVVTSDTDWPTYNGDPGGNRYTTLTQIDTKTVTRLAPKWMYPVADAGLLQGTPVVVGGIMYVTAANECIALDAGSGREIWHFKRPRTKGVAGGGANRGVAVAGDRVFMVTDHAHLIALNRFTGDVLWDSVMDDWRKNYAASSAPLTAGDLVVSGVSGGEHGANGFVAAFDQATGREVWRFWTVPKPGQPGSETWRGKDIAHGGAPTWFTGSYDPSLDTVYWPTGNPSKEYNGDDRQGDNLYASCILALDRATGRLKWHYQFTPHDLWDWDATQTSVLVDAEWDGQRRPLMLHANRNGFFYVFDRRDGTLLLARPFVKNLTWATGIGADGRPLKVPGQEPSIGGTRVCPSQDGATNWYSPSFNPSTGLYYVQTFEKCSIYMKSPNDVWQSGKSYLGGSQQTATEPTPQRILRAIDVRTGDTRWELPQPGPAQSWGGTLTTASGLVIVAEEGGALMVVDASSGAPLWTFQTNQVWRASPMTYMFDGRQFIAIASGNNILAFGIPGLKEVGGSSMTRRTFVLLVLMAGVHGTAAAQSAGQPSGHWEGAIQVPGQALAIEVDLAPRDDKWVGTIAIPAQNLKGFPLSDIAILGSAVAFSMKGVPGEPRFSGTLADDGKAIAGQMTQGGATLPFTLALKGAAKFEEPPKSTEITKDLEGSWEGPLDVQGTVLRLVLKLTNQPGGATGVLVSVDQGNAEIPISSIAQSGTALKLAVTLVNASYAGELKDGQLTGTWTQGPGSWPLVFKRPAK